MNARFHPLADVELSDAAQFYEQSAHGLGTEFLLEIEHLIDLLTKHPQLGREAFPGLRTISARRFPYSLVYQVQSESLIILAVAHQRRAPQYWASRRD